MAAHMPVYSAWSLYND